MPLALPPDPHMRFEEIKNILLVYYDATVQETIKYGKETAGTLSVVLLIYIGICIIMYVAAVHWDGLPERTQLRSTKRVMFVIAHPDDECMFFGPAILKLSQQKDCEVYLLCLSKGNYDQKGDTRKKELWESCRILGIPASNITLFMSSLLPDDPNVRWREDIISSLILNQVEALCIDTVITFDKCGVSRHSNHCSIFYATAMLCMEGKLPSYCRAYALESTNMLRKYSCLLDTLVSYITSPYSYIVSIKERHTIKRAMAAHASQLVWFRKLYLIFSRYLYINTLREIEILDLELDRELGED